MRTLLVFVAPLVGVLIMGGCAPQAVKIEVSGYVAQMAVGEDAVWLTQRSDGAAAVLKIDPKVNEVVATIPLPHLEFAHWLAVGEGSVWITEGHRGQNVYRVDPQSNQLVATIPVGRSAGAVAVTEGAVWVVGDGAVHRIDPRSNSLIMSLPIPAGALAQLAAGDNAVWITNAVGGQVYRIDPQANRVVARIPVAARPEVVLVGEGSV